MHKYARNGTLLVSGGSGEFFLPRFSRAGKDTDKGGRSTRRTPPTPPPLAPLSHTHTHTHTHTNTQTHTHMHRDSRCHELRLHAPLHPRFMKRKIERGVRGRDGTTNGQREKEKERKSRGSVVPTFPRDLFDPRARPSTWPVTDHFIADCDET